MGSRHWTPPYGVRQPGSGPNKVTDAGSGPAKDVGSGPTKVSEVGSGPNQTVDVGSGPSKAVGSGAHKTVGSGPVRTLGSGPRKTVDVGSGPSRIRDGGPAVTIGIGSQPSPSRADPAAPEPADQLGSGSNGSGAKALPPQLMLPARGREAAVHISGPEAAPAGKQLAVRDDKAGEIMFVKHTTDAVDVRLVLARQRDSARAASFRLLRQRLVEHGDPRVILVTSPRTREGKTVSATNLALAYAELGRARVLVVEANFRSASLGEVFGFKPPRSFSAQLERHRSHPVDPWVVVQVAPYDVHVMAINPSCCPACSTLLIKGANFCPDCGRPVSNEPPRLDRSTFAAAIRRFREAFDYVIIDGPPVLTSADVNLIQDTADGILMTTKKGRTDARALKKAMDQVAPAPVLGVVLVEE
jgi:Mrp family chromosome partitioning ATPase